MTKSMYKEGRLQADKRHIFKVGESTNDAQERSVYGSRTGRNHDAYEGNRPGDDSLKGSSGAGITGF